MEANETSLKAATRFANNSKLDIVTYIGKYDEYLAYSATSEALKDTCHGFPVYILVRQAKDGYECRYTTQEETLNIMANRK